MIPTFTPPDKKLRPPEPRVPAIRRRTAVRTALNEYIAGLVAQVDVARISGWIGNLVNFPTRHTLSSHNVEAAEWLRGQFQALGYTDVVFYDFKVKSAIRHNVICTKPGKVAPNKYLIVCAHYDSRMKSLGDAVSIAPGADDNASGVAALLEMARILFAVDTTYSIRFCAFSGEEQGYVGASAYATFAGNSGMQIPLLINMDMVGHPENPSNPTIIVEHDIGNHVRTNDAPSLAFANQMTQAAADYTTLQTTLGPIYSSDYMPFEYLGYVCIGAYDGADVEPFYHTANDTIDKVNMGFCGEVTRMVLATVLTIAGSPPSAAVG